MSQSGSMMVTSARLRVGENVEVHVRIPPDGEDEWSLKACVIRCEANEEDPEGLWPFRIAIEFTELSPELEALLLDHSNVLEGLREEGEQVG